MFGVVISRKSTFWMQLRFGAGFLPKLDFWSSPPEPNINVTNMKNIAGKSPPELPPPPLLVGQTVFLDTEQKSFQQVENYCTWSRIDFLQTKMRKNKLPRCMFRKSKRPTTI